MRQHCRPMLLAIGLRLEARSSSPWRSACAPQCEQPLHKFPSTPRRARSVQQRKARGTWRTNHARSLCQSTEEIPRCFACWANRAWRLPCAKPLNIRRRQSTRGGASSQYLSARCARCFPFSLRMDFCRLSSLVPWRQSPSSRRSWCSEPCWATPRFDCCPRRETQTCCR